MLFLLLTGIIAGILAGLLGIGGGLVVVPAMLWWLYQQGVDQNFAIQIAIATSLASMLLTSLGSLMAHHKKGAVHWQYVLRYAAFVMLGAWLGSFTVAALAAQNLGIWLIIVFALFALFTAYQLLRKKTPQAAPSRPAGGRAGMTFKSWPDIPIGILIGHFSSLVGIGGGSLNAPYFHWRGLSMVHAVGTAACCGYPLALAGTAGFLLRPVSVVTDDLLLGSIAVNAALIIGATGFIFAPLGAGIAHRLPEQRLRQIFAVLLILLAIKLPFV